MGSCAAPSAKGDDKFITTDYLQQCPSADGMRFVTPVKTVNSGPNRKYFGSGRGITWYNFVSDQYSGFHGIVVPGTLRDSIFVLEGLLEQQTGLNPVGIMTDKPVPAILFLASSGCWDTSFPPGLPMPVKRYSGEWINRQITVHWTNWHVVVLICRKPRISGMR
ncbi:transposase [Escherichia coli]|nr:transposase [Escherichia coli]